MAMRVLSQHGVTMLLWRAFAGGLALLLRLIIASPGASSSGRKPENGGRQIDPKTVRIGTSGAGADMFQLMPRTLAATFRVNPR
jgi:hypothetical protein